MRRSFRPALLRSAALMAALMLVPQVAQAGAATDYEFASPLFGMSAARGGGLLVADAGAGVVKLEGSSGSLLASLPGVTDVAPANRRSIHAVTGAPDSKFFRVAGGVATQVANLGRFEATVNPDGGEIDSNPFRTAALPRGRALVADAAANALLIVRPNGSIDWVATLPDELVPTRNAKLLAGCPYAPPDFAFVCDLPARIPAQPVATSVAVGPDGAWYVGELKGFPAPLGRSRVWRIEPGTRHAHCGASPRCSVVTDGLTSIVDLDFNRNGALRVVELDEASWLAVELGSPTTGTVDSCNVQTGVCHVLAGDLPLPSAVASTGGHTFSTIWSLVPGRATVRQIA